MSEDPQEAEKPSGLERPNLQLHEPMCENGKFWVYNTYYVRPEFWYSLNWPTLHAHRASSEARPGLDNEKATGRLRSMTVPIRSPNGDSIASRMGSEANEDASGVSNDSRGNKGGVDGNGDHDQRSKVEMTFPYESQLGDGPLLNRYEEKSQRALPVTINHCHHSQQYKIARERKHSLEANKNDSSNLSRFSTNRLEDSHELYFDRGPEMQNARCDWTGSQEDIEDVPSSPGVFANKEISSLASPLRSQDYTNSESCQGSEICQNSYQSVDEVLVEVACSSDTALYVPESSVPLRDW